VGGPKPSPDIVSEIDWLFIGTDDSTGADPISTPVPTRTDARVEAAMGGIARRAISLRASSFARCTTSIPRGATFVTDGGLASAPEGDVVIRLLRDRVPPTTIAGMHLRATAANAWVPVRVPLADVGLTDGGVMAIELSAASVSPGGRVLFGEPRVTIPAAS